MTPEEHREVQDAFFAVCDLSPGECRAALEAQRLSSPRLLESLEALLAMDAQHPGVFEQESVIEGIRRALIDALSQPPPSRHPIEWPQRATPPSWSST
jgi:hypothetical protein